MQIPKRVIEKIQGVKRWLDRVVISSRHGESRPGDWLYQQDIVGWLYKPELRRQLPASYRAFASYCSLQRPLSNYIVGGERAFRAVRLLHSMSTGSDDVGLDLGVYTIFLDLHDPRMLQVPNELLNGAEANFVRSSLAEGDTFVDVGANHGSFSVIASKLVGTHGLIVAVEPQIRLASLVEKSLAANGPCTFEVCKFACGDRNGEISFFIPTSTSGSAGTFPEFSAVAKHRRFSVPLRRFDEAVDWRGFPGEVLLKLDIEGSELSFMVGARGMLGARTPNILLEINPASSKAAAVSISDMTKFLCDVGYRHYAELKFPLEKESLKDIDGDRHRNVLILNPRRSLERLTSENG